MFSDKSAAPSRKSHALGVTVVLAIITTGKNSNVVQGENWQAEYAAYLLAAEEKEVAADSSSNNNNRKVAVAEETWQAQYAAYCAEKESALSNR